MTWGKPGRSTAPAGAAGLDREEQRREDDDRRHQLRPAEGLAHRALPEGGDHAQVQQEPVDHEPGSDVRRPARPRLSGFAVVVALEVVAGLRDEHVVERGLHQVERLDHDPGLVERADDRARLRRAPLQLHQHAPSLRGSELAEAGHDPLGARRRCPRRGPARGAGLPISAFSDAGVPSATILPVVDDPDAVGELVGLLEVLRGEEHGRALGVQLRDLLPDRLAADRVEAGRRLVEEEHLGLVDERRGEVEPAAHPARVGADPPVGGALEPDAVEQRLGALARPSARGSPCSVACSRISSRPVISGSSAASWSATPIARRTSAASVDDVVAGHPGAAAGRAQQRGQHPHRGRLAGAVGPEEGVDLALGDLEVDAVDGPDLVPETALEPLDLDRGHRR